MRGTILKKENKGFVVYCEGEQYFCLARGVIREIANLQAGDEVEFAKDGKIFVINKLMPRVNQLTRPYISNLTQLIIVIAPLPKPDFLLIDKLIIGCEINNIDPIIVVNKMDIAEIDFYDNVVAQYEHSVEHILKTSATEKQGIEALVALLANNLSAFCGQSAVGKTSLINAIFKNLNLKTDGLSRKINMGKNTTRHTEIYVFDNNTFIADTPGFNMLFHYDIGAENLRDYYYEFNNYAKNCAFKNCSHVNEEKASCGVKQAVDSGKVNKDRYERYAGLYKQMKKEEENKYK